MINQLEILKKRLKYRASYRGTKEMDILLGAFVNKNINFFDEIALFELDKFLNFPTKDPHGDPIPNPAGFISLPQN